MAEPLAGVLSPAMMEEFSCGAVQAVISAVQRADFPVVYHNCGRLAPAAYPMLADLGAAAYHFGNAIQMADALAAMPRDVLVMGNVDPAGVLTSGTPARVREATFALMAACGKAENFLPSTAATCPTPRRGKTSRRSLPRWRRRRHERGGFGEAGAGKRRDQGCGDPAGRDRAQRHVL